MNEDRYNDLLSKLNSQINGFRKQRSHLHGKSDGINDTPGFLITKDLNVESLSKGEILLTHSLLHKLYNGKPEGLTKKDIEQLHTKVVSKIKHSRFDNLDDI